MPSPFVIVADDMIITRGLISYPRTKYYKIVIQICRLCNEDLCIIHKSAQKLFLKRNIYKYFVCIYCFLLFLGLVTIYKVEKAIFDDCLIKNWQKISRIWEKNTSL